MVRLGACLWLILTCAFAGVAPAADADVDTTFHQMATFLSHHGYGAAQMEIVGSNIQCLKLQMNGEDAMVAVNTMLPTMLTIHLANVCRLDIRPTGEKWWWIEGPSENDVGSVQLASFTVNGCPINRTNPVPVFPKPMNEEWGDGSFGYDYLHMNNAILPVAGRILFYKPGNGPAASVAEYLKAMGLKPMPFVYGNQGLKVQGTLGGHAFTALVGSDFRPGSAFSSGYLKSIGEPTFRTYRELYYNNGVRIKILRFRPTELQFGPIKIEPMEILAYDSAYFGHYGCDFVLGRDILAQHGAVIDFGSNTLWMRDGSSDQ